MRNVLTGVGALGLSALCLTIIAGGELGSAATSTGATGASARSASPVIAGVQGFLDRYSRNLVAAADEMPAEKYGYNPMPEQMTFGHMMSHVASSNNQLCASLSGLEAPEMGEIAESDKTKLVEAVEASFDFCGRALDQLDESQMADQVPYFGGRQASKAQVMLALVADWADHYGQAAIYLRLNGLLPPTARRRMGG